MPIPRRIPRQRLLLLLAALATPCIAAPEPPAAAAFDADWILQAVARPAPSRTPFVELRASPMLRQPLRLQGEYRREADGRLVRQVTAPYAETTTLAAGEAVIERAGRAPRRIALRQVPELAAVQAGFGALLAGDRALLLRTYEVRAEGTRERWTLGLTPRDPRLAAALRGIELHGRGSELRCVESTPAKGEPQRTLMAGAAAAASGIADPAGLAALCHGDGAAK
ncbi:fatty acyl CoA synthetase [Pseudoxanthomonas jiangsuensis]|uniref:LolA-related protein n=1 Tax=Pseudoxanthomonas jiangsuensis TaxID=619688 RepID=UPI001391A954|nr:LolA-related protein [Pseudoxanthomonas jiangsuensis]KAF1691903.1 fatty acyl CoA synthetase [Pseudoxanthomonas jiangsuensis]